MLNETKIKKFLRKYVNVPEEVVNQFESDLEECFHTETEAV